MKILLRVGSPIWAAHPDNKPQSAAFESEADETLFGGAAGGGKLLALDTPIPTPGGWTTMSEVRSGDLVIDGSGCPCRVVAKSAIESEDTWRLTFSDGSEVVAGGRHQWVTSTDRERSRQRCDDDWRARRRLSRPSRGTGRRPDLSARNSEWARPLGLPTEGVRTTREIAGTLRKKTRANHSVAVAGALVLPEIQLPIDPYVLGAWLGDGASARAAITTADVEMVREIAVAGYGISDYGRYEYGITGGFRQALRVLGVLGNKHIPPAYLRAAEAQRLGLLQGLMDTDGTCDRRGQCEITLTRKVLIDGVLELLNSLGIKAQLRAGLAKLDGRVIGPKWRLKFITERPAFRLPRKLLRQKRAGFRGTHDRRYIVACERVDPVPMQCIQVDSPSRTYLCGGAMIPTHNSDLLLGTALTSHSRSIIFRKQRNDAQALIERAGTILGDFGKWRGDERAYRTNDKRFMEFGHCSRPGDEQGYMGRPHDLKAFDELTHFSEYEYIFLSSWNRSTDPNQRCRVIGASNPPTTPEGFWVVRRWGAWLDPQHPNPAEPGELRWYARIDGKDTEVAGPEHFEHIDVAGRTETIEPRSRTYIPSKLDDNPYYSKSGYRAVLQALPEPLRSILLHGQFDAAMEDNPWQIIPTLWVELAMQRWTEKAAGPMDTIGVDPAMGGRDQLTIARRHGDWYDELVTVPGVEVPTGVVAAGHVIRYMRDGAVAQVDTIGIGAACYEHLIDSGVTAAAMDARHKTEGKDKSGTLAFRNKRAEWWWAMREALDPDQGDGIALPDDRELLADLTAPRWEPTPQGIKVEAKEDIAERLGRSTDKGDAVVMALPQEKPKMAARHRPRPMRANNRYNPISRRAKR